MRSLLALAISSAFAVFAQPAGSAHKIQITRGGSQRAQPAPAENFTGAAKIESSFQSVAPARVYGATVTFEPAARTAWHSHALGQFLIVTAGTGRVQRWGDPVEEIRPGDIVLIPAGVKHWHGAAPNSSLTHIAIAEQPAGGPATLWMEKVTDAQYAEFQPARPPTAHSDAGRRVMGDVAPALADITDRVLFDEVWQRPQLSQRDRSLITVAALIAMNRPDQLRSHMVRARANGLTAEELVETITHLAFYAGWPNAATAVGVAREVLKTNPPPAVR